MAGTWNVDVSQLRIDFNCNKQLNLQRCTRVSSISRVTAAGTAAITGKHRALSLQWRPDNDPDEFQAIPRITPRSLKI
jgi:hypothetical protein